MSALTETMLSPTLVGFPSHLTPSATFRPSPCNPSPKLERHLKKYGLNQLKWSLPKSSDQIEIAIAFEQ